MWRPFFLLALFVATGCVPGNTVGDLVRPKMTKASTVIDGDEVACRSVSDHAKPLVVDWSSEGRTQLELTMRDGVAVVAYDCKQLRLLDRCRLRGSYRFAGVTLKQEVVQLENKDELQANLPLSGVSLSAGMKSGSTLDLALAIVGKSSSSLRGAARSELEGDCEGATHFVRAATLGAFAMANGTVGEARAAVDIFGAGASGGSRAKQDRARKDGDLQSCSAAGRDAKGAPVGCGALLRVDLSPLGDERVEVERKDGDGGDASLVPEPTENPCPEGMVEQGLKCVIDRGKNSCDYGEYAACKSSCDAGIVTGCTTLANQYMSGRGVTRDLDKAQSTWERACQLGDEPSCHRRATQPLSVCREDCTALIPKARQQLQAACDRGYAPSCARLGANWLPGTNSFGLSSEQRLKLRVRACDLGDEHACRHTAAWLLTGKELPVDVKRAIELLERSCEGGGKDSCFALADLLTEGKQAKKDAPRAFKALVRGCELGGGHLCVRAAQLGMGDHSLPFAMPLILRVLRRGCFAENVNGRACMMLSVLVGLTGTSKDVDEERRLLVRGCEANEPKACRRAAELTAKRSRRVAEARCDAGEPAACQLVAQMMLERGCEQDDEESCQKLEDGAPDRWRAVKVVRCRKRWRHDQSACEALAQRGLPLPDGAELKATPKAKPAK